MLRTFYKNYRGLFFLLLFALAVKGTILSQLEVILPDGCLYVNQAQLILEGDLRGAMALHGNMFFYPLLIAGLHSIIPDLILSGQLISLLLSVLALIPLYLLSQELVGKKAALWAGIAFVIAPELNFYSTKIMRDPGFLCFFASAAYFGLKALTLKKSRYYLLSSIFSIFAILFRIEGFFFPAIFTVVSLLACVVNRQALRPMAKGIFLFLLPYFVISASLFLYLGQDVCKFNRVSNVIHQVKICTNSGFFNYRPQVKEYLKNMEKSLPGGMTDNDFGELARKNLRLFYFFGLLLALAKVVYVPFLGTFVLGLKQRQPFDIGRCWLLSLFLTYLTMAYIFLLKRNFLEDRFVYVPAILMFPWIGLGLSKLFVYLRRLPFSYGSVFIAFLIMVLMPFFEQFKELGRQEVSVKLAGEWVKVHDELHSAKMVANNRRIPFYSGRGLKYVACARDNYPLMEQLAVRHNAEIIAIETRLSRVTSIPNFQNYHLAAKFEDKKDAGLIYKRKK